MSAVEPVEDRNVILRVWHTEIGRSRPICPDDSTSNVLSPHAHLPTPGRLLTTDRELLERGGTLFPLPAGHKAPPPTGVTGKLACVQLSAAKREALLSGPEDSNVGLLLGHLRVEMPDGSYRGVFVLDEDNKPERTTASGDVHKAQHGALTVAALEKELGPLPLTLRSLTPGHGSHRLFWAPDALVDVPSKLLAKNFGAQCGLEILTEGRYIVYPGSVLTSEVSAAAGYVAGEYRWEDPDASIAEFPIKWCDYILKLAGGAVTQRAEESQQEPFWLERVPVTQRETDAAAYVTPLKKEGAGDGSGQLVKVAGVVKLGFGCGVEGAFRVLRSAPFCQDWDDYGIRKRCEEANGVPLGCMYEKALPPDMAHLAGAKDKSEIFQKSVTVQDSGLGTLGERWGGWDKPVLPPIYLLEGIIPEAKVVTFFAEGGSVKTWSALALAIAVATGKPWLDQYAVKQGKVLYLDYEDGPYEVSRRVSILNNREDVPDLGYLYGGPQIDRAGLWTALAQKVLDEQIKLVVVDSLGAGMPGDADENTTAFAQGIKIAGRFTETGCTVVFVHHSNKSGGMRGTSAARDQSDCVFKFEPVSETDAVKRMRMVCDKPGPQRRPKPVNVELTDRGLTTFVDDVNEKGRNASTPEDLEGAVLLALKDGPLLTKDDVRRAVGKDRNKVYEALKNLEEANKVTHIEDVGYVLNSPEAREARVLESVRSFFGRESEAALAARSHVSTKFVKAMVLKKVLRPRVVGDMSSGFQESAS